MTKTVVKKLLSRNGDRKVKNYRQQLDAVGLHHLEVRIMSLSKSKLQNTKITKVISKIALLNLLRWTLT